MNGGLAAQGNSRVQQVELGEDWLAGGVSLGAELEHAVLGRSRGWGGGVSHGNLANGS